IGPRNPGFELIELADGLVLAAIDLQLSRRFRAGRCERDRRALVARRLLLLVAACLARCGARFACGRAIERRGALTMAFWLLAGGRHRENTGAALVARIRLDIGGIEFRILRV